MEEFWIVVCDTAALYATYRHTSEQSAIDEAKRLARDNSGKRFMVFHLIGSALIERPVEYIPSIQRLPF